MASIPCQDKVVCPLGAVISETCDTDNHVFRHLDLDEQEILKLRRGLESSISSVCDYHFHRYFELFSCRQKICVDPFGRHRKRVTRGLRIISLDTVRLHRTLNLIPGKKLCATCRRDVASHHDDVTQTPQVSSSETSSMQGDNDPDPLVSPSMIEGVVLPAINQAFDVIGETPLEPSRLIQKGYGERKLQQIQTGVRKVLDIEEPEQDFEEMIGQLKSRFQNATRSDKITILTLLPKSWSIRKIQDEFQVTNWMARTAKRIQEEKGVMSSPNPKKGKRLSEETIDIVKTFYRSDEISRVMPGKKDCISIYSEAEGKRVPVQKHLVLCNLAEAYEQFKVEHPGVKVGTSKFAELRPRECVLAGASGTHSVCVCTIHQNVKLMLSAIDEVNSNSYHHYLAAMCCNPGQPACFLGECKYCPGVHGIREDLGREFEDKGIEMVTYKQWTSTDRCDLLTVQSEVDDFLDIFCSKLKVLCPHDFIAKQQSSFLKNLKEGLREGQVIVQSDFSENYAFLIQDAAQGYHWTNTQATLHPSVVYYRDSAGTIQSISVAMVSDSLVHDTVAVSYFQEQLFPLIRAKVEPTEIFYFSDGASAQYKNRKNFANLAFHTEDYGVPAEWHFFATSHGKGPCDGIGGTVKRLATRASLQRPIDNQIQTPIQLYEWARQNLSGVTTVFCPKENIFKHETKLKKRLDKSITIVGTQKLHAFYATAGHDLLQVKRFSNSPDSRLVNIIKE